MNSNGTAPKKETASVWDEFFARHKRRNFTPAFNARLEAMIADERLDLAVRFEALVLRRSWREHSDCCIFPDGVRMVQSDLARELEVDPRAISPIVQAFVRGNYIRKIGREIHPVDDPLEGRSVFARSSPLTKPFSRNYEEKEKTDESESDEANFFTLENYIQTVFQSEDPAGYRAYQEAARVYNTARLRLVEKFKAWREAGEAEAAFRPSSDPVGQAESPKGSDNRLRILYMKTENGVYSADAENTPETGTAARADDRWKALLFAADQGWLRYGEGELPTIRRAWQKLSDEERLAAIEGIKLRIETGEYADPQYVPYLVNYIRKKLWTTKPKPKAATRVAGDAKQRVREEFMRRVAEDLEYERRQREEEGEGAPHA